MQKLWNKFEITFSKIKLGTLEVIYKDGNIKLYGEKVEEKSL